MDDLLIRQYSHAKARYENLKRLKPSQVLNYREEMKQAFNQYERIRDSFLFDMKALLPTFCYLLRMSLPKEEVIVDGMNVETLDGKKTIWYFCSLKHKEDILNRIKIIPTSTMSLSDLLNLLSAWNDCCVVTSYSSEKKPKYFTKKEWSICASDIEDCAFLYESTSHPWGSMIQFFLKKLVESNILLVQNGIPVSNCTTYDEDKRMIRLPNIL